MPENGRPRALEIIERNAVALNQIIEDVLDMSRIVAGKLHLNVRPVRLQDLLADATASILPAAAARGVRVETFVDQAAGAVSGDPDRLQQVVWNLLSNAVKFTPQGGSVRVRLERVESRVDIVVTDTGEGIPRQFLPHVFERFRQADAGFSRGHGGLGLGLAIVREIVEMHGGSVQAESDGPGAGSTFRVMLPLARTSLELSEAPGARQSAWPHKNASPRERRRLDGVRVVAVDDEEDALGLLRTILEAAGADVRTLPSAAEALVEIERDPPDVLVSDLGMPEMDGVALIRRVRQSPNPRVQTVPALALTAYARSDDRITSLASGYQMHVPKPADPDEILTAVSSLMGRSGTRI
jgi:CheY-like chemotaxis protein/two-component sensor histidine kinase